mgnify:CR=1 FL=1|tara:strand:- start:418 stop:927 length:510 start_codon:yes stop_codon:yes gene_type:complete
MKRLLPLLLLIAAPVNAGGISHKIVASSQATVDGAYSISNRVGSSYSMSSTGVTATAMGRLTAPASATAAATWGTAGTYAQTTAGTSTSFTETMLQGDVVAAMGSGSTVASGVVASLPAFGNATTYSGGVAGDLAATITSVSGGTVTLTPGGAGTSIIGSISSELSIGR